jgi:hypothetical protein
MTPLLGQVMLTATSTNRPEHAADPHNDWGSKGRGFKSRRPDSVRVSAGQKLAEAPMWMINKRLWISKIALDPFTRCQTDPSK